MDKLTFSWGVSSFTIFVIKFLILQLHSSLLYLATFSFALFSATNLWCSPCPLLHTTSLQWTSWAWSVDFAWRGVSLAVDDTSWLPSPDPGTLSPPSTGSWCWHGLLWTEKGRRKVLQLYVLSSPQPSHTPKVKNGSPGSKRDTLLFVLLILTWKHLQKNCYRHKTCGETLGALIWHMVTTVHFLFGGGGHITCHTAKHHIRN